MPIHPLGPGRVQSNGLGISALLLLGMLSAAVQAQEPGPSADAPVSFVKEVAPLLVKNCQACHGPQDPKGGFQLYTFELMLKPGDSSLAPITPGHPDDSELLRLISEQDPTAWMPKQGERLPEEQISLVRRWIEQGATFDGRDPKALLASIIPKVPNPQPPEVYPAVLPITAVDFAPSGQELAVGGHHEITIWNPADGTLLRRLRDVAQRTYALEYNSDGSLLAAASGTPGQTGEVKLFDPSSGTVVRDLGSMSDVAFDVEFSPDAAKVAACSADRSIRIYDVASGQEEVLIEDHADWVMAIAWNHDGTRLASASRDKTTKVFDGKSGDSLATYPGHGEPVFGVDWNADGSQVLSGGRDRKIHIWNPADGNKIAEIDGFGHDIHGLTLGGGQIFKFAADHAVRQHQADNRSLVRAYSGHADWVFTLSYHEGTKRLATGSFDGDVRIWNTEDGSNPLTFKASPGYQPPVMASP